MSSYLSDYQSFLKRFWWIILLGYLALCAATYAIITVTTPKSAAYSTVTPAPSATSTPTATQVPEFQPVDSPPSTAAVPATPLPPTLTPPPTQTLRSTATRKPSATPKPTKIPPTPTVCPAVCPAAMTTVKCDAQSAYCRATVGHCGSADDCNSWCTQAYGYNPQMTWSCSKPSPEPKTQGVCICQIKLP